MHSERILVTGGAGYIGSHIVVELLQAGREVVVLDSLVRGRREALQRAGRITGADIPLEMVDLCDTAKVQDVIQRYAPNTIIHVAAFKSVAESVQHPELYERNNVQATKSLVEAAKITGVRNVVYASTGSVYGERACEAFHETDPTSCINPYAATKLGGEQVLDAFAASHGAHVANMRFFNVVGAHPSGELGEFGDESTNLLPVLMDLLNGARESVTVFGTDWDTADGTCIRDYVHVCDIASAMVAAMNHLDQIEGSRIYNLGTGIGTSVRAMVRSVEEASGQRLKVLDGPRRAGDPGVSVAGVARVKTELGWTAKYDLDSMVQSALAWNKRATSAA